MRKKKIVYRKLMERLPGKGKLRGAKVMYRYIYKDKRKGMKKKDLHTHPSINI